MITKNIIKQNTYYDSVTLMMISSKLASLPGIIDATVMMGTDYNKQLMKNSGLMLEENMDATSNDMIIGVKAESDEAADTVAEAVKNELENKVTSSSDGELRAKTMDSAVKRLPGANIAVISIPGKYAKREAEKALENDMHVLLFSDNVSVEEENYLKDLAVQKGMLMMGPDCGTAIINGKALGFANIVKRGSIGMVAAAGTGLQEVSSLVHQYGRGISQAIGTGGRDVKDAVGAKMMMLGLEALSYDEETKVIIIVSKPPGQIALDKVTEFLESSKEPVVTCFIGGEKLDIKNEKVVQTFTLEDAAAAAVSLDKNEEVKPVIFTSTDDEIISLAKKEQEKLTEGQKYIRGLYSGGTLSAEAMIIMRPSIGDVYSNVALNKHFNLEDVETSKENTVLDLGDDYFTNGRPHPMIDPRLRVERIKKEGSDASVAVILFDVVLGYGSNMDMAGELIGSIESVQEKAKEQGRYISFIASVCGTDEDIQSRKDQIKKLEDAGVTVMPSNAQASRLAVLIAKRSSDVSDLKGEK